VNAAYEALGSALVDRAAGDRIDNIERALDSYRHTVDLADDPLIAAMSKHNLARTLMLRVRGDRRADLDEAISCFEESIEVLRSSPETVPGRAPRRSQPRSGLPGAQCERRTRCGASDRMPGVRAPALHGCGRTAGVRQAADEPRHRLAPAHGE